MTLTTSSFFAFLLVTLVLFYVFRPIQKYILLTASIWFYFCISSINVIKLSLLIVIIGLVSYIGALLIERSKGAFRKLVFWSSISILLVLLFSFKYLFNIVSSIAILISNHSDFSFLKLGAVIGMSYFTLSAIGYLIDVYWENSKAETNPANVFLFIFFFPQLISGPVTRFGKMNPQFSEARTPDPDRILLGIRRMCWGYFKKLVISDRFSIIVDSVYCNYSDFSFAGLTAATFCYAIQLYTDFSGCMDIIMGAAALFGIDLPENFNAPFFSETIKEFWQRWHITLGLWFKDYLMYPIQRTAFVQKIGKKAKKAFGKKAGKKIPLYISMFCLWFLLGLWHGGTIIFMIASGIMPFLLLTLSDICQPLFQTIVNKLKINTATPGWKAFRMIRTLLLVCTIWMVVCSGEIHNCLNIIKHAFTHPIALTSPFTATAAFGLTACDIILMAFGLILLFISDLAVYKGYTIFSVTDKLKKPFRIIAVYIEVFIIFAFGLVGQSPFIYFQF